MAAAISQDDLKHVDQFWGMLDEMAENDPEGYKKFIQRQLRDAKEQCAPPEPHLSLRTKILGKNEKHVYINVCKWNLVPAPQSNADPVPLSAGRLDEICEDSELYSVIDVAYNPKVLKIADEDGTEMDQLIRLAMKYIEESHRVILCHTYQIANFKLKGSLRRMQESLRGLKKQATDGKEQNNGQEASLLQQIKNISVKGEDKEVLSHPMQLFKEENVKPLKTCLIEELSSTEIQEKDSLPTPHHELSIVKENPGASQVLQLRVELPGLNSVSECDLSISKDDVLLEALGKYRLQLDLPHSINEDTVLAKFNKHNHTLFVTMQIL